MKNNLLRITREILSNSTAPFREKAVREYVQSFCLKRNILCKEDDFGNLIVGSEIESKGKSFTFVAHMDHPGFFIEKITGKNSATALFYGGWDPSEFKAAPVLIFSSGGPVKARAIQWEIASKEHARRAYLKFNGTVSVGDTGMWDLDVFRKENDLIFSRACDDLIGCALILTVLDFQHKNNALSLRAVFTVAEECGLHGAKYICSKKLLSKRTTLPISVETSRALPNAALGDGVIIRVGDSRTIFSPEVIDFMIETARELKKNDKKFTYQRKLMDGGQCEGSIFSDFGFSTAGISIPLCNYHNRNFSKGTTESEYVSINDLLSAVKLIDALSKNNFRGSLRKIPKYKEESGILGQRFLLPLTL
ncbi:MAG: M28 family peptidase [Fibrobacter sp.]|nr:M28 family peptidase [Fibrobacter sp.]